VRRSAARSTSPSIGPKGAAMTRTVLDYERAADGSTEIFDAVTGRVIVHLPASFSFVASPLWHLLHISSSLKRRAGDFRHAR
jgi:hypothetical protein